MPGLRLQVDGRGLEVVVVLLDVDSVEGRARQAQLVRARIDARGRERAAARQQDAAHLTRREWLDHLAGAADERGAGLKLGGDVGAERHREVGQLGLRRALLRRGRGQAQHGGRVRGATAQSGRHAGCASRS